ncbi:phosphatidate cytidylyltransferase [Rhodoferax lacus]|uniref:Phosphatidate cytidylyltransferase n=1 Tax=Rhodoferax lacus TaxID=2184758 RepID=A0A3E1REB7_9BURK|nr:phosphatidate cytidylyltransferase [Rhodoferax lacus]RFO96940.1 phosphatidate cytidylyltransferase [Rhodoferax lacus]
MLKQRIITALVLLAILLPATFYSTPVPFGVVTLVLLACAAWEWARLNGFASTASLCTGVACAALCAGSWFWGLPMARTGPLWLVVGGFWVLASAWVLRAGAASWLALPAALRLLGGLVLLWAAWLAVMQARLAGINFLLSVLVLVWSADIGAYFAGRKLGGKFFANKLAPSISPGKTWEGVVGGATTVLLVALGWIYADGHGTPDSASVYSHLWARGLPVLLIGVAFLTAMSVVGDLVESLFKRAAGVKDSSNLLPGHGGVLDRVDALLPILPLAMMLVSEGLV